MGGHGLGSNFKHLITEVVTGGHGWGVRSQTSNHRQVVTGGYDWGGATLGFLDEVCTLVGAPRLPTPLASDKEPAGCRGSSCPNLRYTQGTANLRSKILDFRGFDSSRVLILRGGIPRPKGVFPESLSQAILAGIILVGRLGVGSRGSPFSPLIP